MEKVVWWLTSREAYVSVFKTRAPRPLNKTRARDEIQGVHYRMFIYLISLGLDPKTTEKTLKSTKPEVKKGNTQKA